MIQTPSVISEVNRMNTDIGIVCGQIQEVFLFHVCDAEKRPEMKINTGTCTRTLVQVQISFKC